jgi:DNA-binding NarL/FixJ family response regulator
MAFTAAKRPASPHSERAPQDSLPGMGMNVSANRPATEPTTILIVDDHALLREGLRGLLQSQDDMRVVGEAGDSVTAAAVAAQQCPDIVLLDIGVPGGDGGNTVGQIRASSPCSRVIVLSMHEGPRLVQEALASGAQGYLLKSIRWQQLVAAIRAVRADGDWVVLGVSRESLACGVPEQQGSEALSAREREILALVGQALSNRQIASRLMLTEATVKRHLRNIFAKLDAVSRIDAVNKAARDGQGRHGGNSPDGASRFHGSLDANFSRQVTSL